VRYVVNLLEADVDPREWARRREAEGWDALAVADHVFTATRPYPHVWVTAAAMAMATHDVTITTAFVNNLLRSPVEVAQAARQLQVVSDGRFELGLGAGWADEEITGSGLRYPQRCTTADCSDGSSVRPNRWPRRWTGSKRSVSARCPSAR
jgi:alkanesulfonate monooxygenase SsuD/methylene tetrahydromethanopterin reductase-like flavin-dependent oxidoreductase (luciferase family)